MQTRVFGYLVSCTVGYIDFVYAVLKNSYEIIFRFIHLLSARMAVVVSGCQELVLLQKYVRFVGRAQVGSWYRVDGAFVFVLDERREVRRRRKVESFFHHGCPEGVEVLPRVVQGLLGEVGHPLELPGMGRVLVVYVTVRTSGMGVVREYVRGHVVLRRVRRVDPIRMRRVVVVRWWMRTIMEAGRRHWRRWGRPDFIISSFYYSRTNKTQQHQENHFYSAVFHLQKAHIIPIEESAS